MDMDPLDDPDIHRLYLQLLSGEAQAFIQPTPPPRAPMLGGQTPPPQAPMLGGRQQVWVVDPAGAGAATHGPGVLPLQGCWARNDFGFAPGGAGEDPMMHGLGGVNALCMPEYSMGSLPPCQPAMVDSPLVAPAAGPSPSSSGSPGLSAHVSATDSSAPTSQMGAYPQTSSVQPVAEDGPGFVPGGAMTLGGDYACPGTDRSVRGDVNAVWMPEYSMGSLPAMADWPSVPPAAGPSPSSSGLPGLGAQARATDSLAPTSQMGAYLQTPSALDVPQTVPEGGPVFVPGAGHWAPDEYSMGWLQACQLPMVDSPPVPFAASSGSPGLASQATATDSPAPTSQMGAYPQAAAVDVPQVPEHGAGFVPGAGDWTAREDAMIFAGNDVFPNIDQLVHGGVYGLSSGVRDLLMSGADLSEFISDEEAVNALWMPEYSVGSLVVMADSTPVPPLAWPGRSSSGSPGLGAQARATDSPAPTSQMGAYPPVLDHPQPVPDDEAAEVALMVRMAAWCGDRPSTAWSVEEDQLLLQGLCQFAGQDNVSKCFSIAYGLAGKTVIDVAYRIRWLSDLEKKKAAKEVQLGQEKSALGNATKGKETKSANKKNNRYPLSKEALDSRSAIDLIWDNDRLMYKIEEILRTGQVKNIADYFYYVKMNMDALPNKVRDLASVMEGLSVGDEEWEDVFKDRNASAEKDAALPPPPRASLEMADSSQALLTVLFPPSL